MSGCECEQVAYDHLDYGDGIHSIRSALAEGSRLAWGVPLGLREFLNAGMPEWMAVAACDQMRREQYGLAGKNLSEVSDKWWVFVRAYAALPKNHRTPW